MFETFNYNIDKDTAFWESLGKGWKGHKTLGLPIAYGKYVWTRESGLKKTGIILANAVVAGSLIAALCMWTRIVNTPFMGAISNAVSPITGPVGNLFTGFYMWAAVNPFLMASLIIALMVAVHTATYIMNKEDPTKTEAAAIAAKNQAEQDKAAAVAGKNQAEQDKAAAIAAKTQAEQDKAAAVAAKNQAEQDKAAAVAAKNQAEQDKAAAVAGKNQAEQKLGGVLGAIVSDLRHYDAGDGVNLTKDDLPQTLAHPLVVAALNKHMQQRG